MLNLNVMCRSYGSSPNESLPNAEFVTQCVDKPNPQSCTERRLYGDAQSSRRSCPTLVPQFGLVFPG